MPKKKSRQPARRTSRKRGDRPGSYRPQALRSHSGTIGAVLANGSPEHLYTILPALLWIDRVVHHKAPGNICVDAALTLHRLYQLLDVAAEVLPVQLMVQEPAGGGEVYGSLTPHFTRDRFAGHCVVHLPTAGRFIDATVGQFPAVARHGTGPLVGLTNGASPSTHRFNIARGEALLTYAFAEEGYRDIIHAGPMAQMRASEILEEQALAVLGYTLAMIAMDPEYQDKGRAAGIPRFTHLIDLTQNTDYTGDRGGTFERPDGTSFQIADVLSLT